MPGDHINYLTFHTIRRRAQARQLTVHAQRLSADAPLTKPSSLKAMKVKIWGSRGSLPASVQSHHIRHKLHEALKIAIEHNLSSENDIDAFIEAKLRGKTRSDLDDDEIE